MPQVTQIKPQKRKNRFNIYFGGQFAFGLSAEGLVKSGLSVGDHLSEKEVEKLIHENEFQRLLDKALHFLSYRPRSEKEIRDYLKKKTPSLKIITQIIAKLKKQNLIDDLAFAEWFCQQRAQFRPRGQRVLLAELWQKGIKKEIAQKAIGKTIDEKDLAQKVALKKLNTFQKQKLSPRLLYQKMIQLLLRRGFDWEVSKKTIDSLLKKE